jgi:hypothetical protein
MTDENARQEADVRTMMAVLMVAVLASLLLGLMAVILPSVLGIVLIVGGMAWFGVMHYLLWGWWLGPYLCRMQNADATDRIDADR